MNVDDLLCGTSLDGVHLFVCLSYVCAGEFPHVGMLTTCPGLDLCSVREHLASYAPTASCLFYICRTASLEPLASVPLPSSLLLADGMTVTFPAYLAIFLGTLIPVAFLIILYIQAESRKAGEESVRGTSDE